LIARECGNQLTSPELRDRDAIITSDNLIFRVYGYSHPSSAYVCDVEYAPAPIFESKDPRACRGVGKALYYKFYSDQGLRFVQEKCPQYMVWYAPLQTRLLSVYKDQIIEVRRPDQTFLHLSKEQPRDCLLQALHGLTKLILERSGLSETDFGVFGSLLHGFYHPFFSDLDLVLYGGEKVRRLRQTLETLYQEEASPIRNEFATEEALRDKNWRFVNYSPREHCWHQQRKMVYSLFEDKNSGRVIKTEFEPVKQWHGIHNEYDPETRIAKKGWIRAIARVTDDSEAPFMPSVYKIELGRILEGVRVDYVQRIISYVEEFRMQAERDEEVYVEGNLEQVVTSTGTFHQITLTYGPRYYEQVLKVRWFP